MDGVGVDEAEEGDDGEGEDVMFFEGPGSAEVEPDGDEDKHTAADSRGGDGDGGEGEFGLLHDDEVRAPDEDHEYKTEVMHEGYQRRVGVESQCMRWMELLWWLGRAIPC